MNKVTLSAKGERWARSGHPWVYADDLHSADAASGEIVQVQSSQGRPLGQAFYNAKSKIALRWLTDDPQVNIDEFFWRERLAASIEYRKKVVEESTAYRLVYSEADGFPGLIVDRYDQWLVLQSLSLGMEGQVPLLVELLEGLLRPQGILARNDAAVRTLEGLPLEKKVLKGKEEPRPVEVTEGKHRYLVDIWEGHKTGAYLDQRENRLWVRSIARGRVLDAFAYQGGFSIQASLGAREVLALEDSEWALTQLKKNLELNQIKNVQAEKANAFDRLRALEKEGERFDMVILDPPAFAKSKAELPGALRGYKEINLRAMKILRPGGILLTCSCSYQVNDEIFTQAVRAAAADSTREVRLIETRAQSKDHPIVMTHPESKYLKCFVLQAV